MLTTVLVKLATVALAAFAFIDEPPSWEEFDVCEPAGTYCAEVRSVGQPEGPQRAYRIRVIDRSKSPPHELWSANYDYDGYPEGRLTEDGKTFIYVNTWYRRDGPVVSIYREGRRFTLEGGDFNIAESKLQATASHSLWCAGYHVVEGRVLLIVTIDGRKHRVSLTTGQLER